MVNVSVLVLNQNYEPLNVCPAKRAVVLLDRGKAEVLEHDSGTIHSPSRSLVIPSVIRLVYMIKRPRHQVKLSRAEIFARDRYTCQYCGRQTSDLTIDHVVPRNKGGQHIWENVASACKMCNHHKGGRTPAEARMKLLRQPQEPRMTSYHVFYHHLQTKEQWRKFIPGWEIEVVAN